MMPPSNPGTTSLALLGELLRSRDAIAALLRTVHAENTLRALWARLAAERAAMEQHIITLRDRLSSSRTAEFDRLLAAVRTPPRISHRTAGLLGLVRVGQALPDFVDADPRTAISADAVIAALRAICDSDGPGGNRTNPVTPEERTADPLQPSADVTPSVALF
ncbi:MAG: hypothetical protein KIT73_19830 [Burkholderiales bacterium]|nr:hypothetical protein [Burkholderiales bacterium]